MASWRAASEVGKAAVKLSTNLTGLEVARNPHHMLGVFYSKTLRALAKMPADYPYRRHTEQVISERAAIVKSTTDIQELEKKINCGQIEEVIIQAENELMLARTLLESQSWEPLTVQPHPNQWKWPL